MTAVVGLIHEGRVLLGADSAGTAGFELTLRRDSKVFTNGPYVFGFTTSFRMGQLIRYAFSPPPPPAGDLERFLVTTWMDELRETLRKGGWSKLDSQQETGGTFLVGVSGRLFRVVGDFQIGESLDSYDAVGCGADLACGAMHATAGMAAESRVLAVLAAAEHHCTDVAAPFNLAWEER